MKKITRLFLLYFFLLFLGVQSVFAADWTIVPGKRFGPIKRDTSEQDLVKMFGVKNVTQTKVEVGEGNTEPGTELFSEDPSKTACLLWLDPKTRKCPSEIRVHNKGTLWKTDKGITIGTSLKTIHKLNKKSFIMAGFGFDYSGTIIHSNGGYLTELGTQAEEGQDRSLLLRLEPDNKLATTSDYNSVTGDKFFSSDNPAMVKLNPCVYELIGLFLHDEAGER